MAGRASRSCTAVPDHGVGRHLAQRSSRATIPPISASTAQLMFRIAAASTWMRLLLRAADFHAYLAGLSPGLDVRSKLLAKPDMALPGKERWQRRITGAAHDCDQLGTSHAIISAPVERETPEDRAPATLKARWSAPAIRDSAYRDKSGWRSWPDIDISGRDGRTRPAESGRCR